MSDERMISPKPRAEDAPLDTSLRPRTLGEYIGQDKVKENLSIFIEAAKARGEVLDHVLLYGPPGLGKCITADSLILTAQGWVPFHELIPVSMERGTSRPQETNVYGRHGLEPTSHIYASGFVPTRRILTRSGFEIEGTPNHAVLVAMETGPQWKRLDMLSTDDYVAIGRGMNVWGTAAPSVTWQPDASADRRAHSEVVVSHLHAQLSQALGRPPATVELCSAYTRGPNRNSTPGLTARRLGLPLTDGRTVETVAQPWMLVTHLPEDEGRAISLDADLGYFLGILIGEGHFEKGTNFPAFTLTSGEPDIQSRLQRIIHRHFGQVPKVHQYGHKTPKIRFSQNYGHVMLALGVTPVTAKEKVVPSAVLTGTRAVAVGFLQGLFDADGNVWPEGYVEFGTRSEILSRQVQLLLANLGIIAHRTKRQVSGNSFWQLFIGGQDAVRFHEVVGFRLARKRARAEGLKTKPRGWSRSDLVPCANGLLRALLERSRPHSRAVHKAFDHVKRNDRTPTRQQIERYLSMLPDRVRTAPEFATLTALTNPFIYWDRVARITESAAETFDFVVPGSHSFLANGFFNHNTTLAHVIANEMDVGIKVTSGPVIERAGDLAAILTNLRQGDVLFIDEVHRLGRVVEEVLYPAMEDYALDIVIGKGPGARSIRLKLPHFTIIGATTRLALMTSPLRARFGATYRLDFYDQTAMETIVRRSARILGIDVDEGGAQEIARRGRGTPRVANRLLKRVRDYAQVRAQGRITEEVARQALALLEVDALGLDDIDRRVLQTIIEKFDGGPVGLDTIAAATSEESDTIMDVVEPYLLQLGFLDRTPRGRVATRRAYEHLGRPYPAEVGPQQATLF